MTSLSAKIFNLKYRGEIKIDNYADLVIFDENKIEDKATFENPKQIAAGISYVLVNGTIVYDEGKATGKRPGKVLKRF